MVQLLQLTGILSGRRVGTTRNESAGPPGLVMKSESVGQLISSALKGKLSADPGMRFGDGMYYLPRQEDVELILRGSKVDRMRWMEERFDCDDFSYVLKGEMSAHAYATPTLKFGLCVGLIWGNFSWVQGYHAVNWFLDSTRTMKLIEPQTDEIYAVDQCLGDVSLVLV